MSHQLHSMLQTVKLNALAWINYSSSYLATTPKNTFVNEAEKTQPTAYQFSYNECIIH